MPPSVGVAGPEKRDAAIGLLKRPVPLSQYSQVICDKLQKKMKVACDKTSMDDVFNRIDADGDGVVSFKEWKLFLRNDLKVSSNDLSEKDIDEFLKALDDDGSGTLDLIELAGGRVVWRREDPDTRVSFQSNRAHCSSPPFLRHL